MARICMQALILVLMMFSVAADPVDDQQVQIAYKPLIVKKSLFGDFAMLAQERDEYATTLTRFSIESAHAKPTDKIVMESVRRLIGLALNLSPRNRSAVVANHQLGRGILPEKKSADYSRPVFARLLLTRGRLLKEQKGEGNQFVGECFVELAAELDPHNEDAVYECELQKLDEREVDWSVFTRQPE
ncbi:hypothetical protein [Roseibacillus persicicus]|nr:hypothetical protein [Roseibacillus persicicus]